ncbi:3'-5' exonuclease [Chloroflexus sp.]|uniref:3'-5' exonuclease n=1 Tax=Chloroflexus sp. TaxID=1904827 RepID=UPI00257FA0EA|nr:3'-5' exonuclease [Chloroflexus sp.]
MAKYQLITPPTFFNELLGLPGKIQKLVTQKVKILEHDPVSAQGDAKKLKNREPPLYRIRIGDYRLIYTFGAGWVKLVAIRKRDDQTYQRDFGHVDLPDVDLAEAVAVASASELLTAEPEPAPSPARQLSSDVAATGSPSQPLPYQLTTDNLRRWLIPEQYWTTLMQIQTEDDLINAPVPPQVIDRLLDILYPRSVDEILQQPQFLIAEADDLDRFVAGELTDFLLVLDPEQQRLVTASLESPVLVRGGPGTGKSIVALYRVQRLVQQGMTPVLFTTFTNTLTAYSEQLLERLLEGDLTSKGVEVNTVDALMFRQYAGTYGTPRIATEEQMLQMLREALHTTILPAANEHERSRRREVLQTLGETYLLDEFISVIEHWGLQSHDEYLTRPRIGRKLPLRPPIREAIWAVYETWKSMLQHQQLTTWGQLRQRALELALQQSRRPYRAIVIDEAQDLSPVALRYLLACVESPRAVYLTADAGQSLYQRGFSWQQIDSELNVRGRSFVLRRNYRNTAEIAAACTSILGTTDSDQEVSAVHHGSLPVVRFCRSVAEEAQAIRSFFIAAARRWRLPAHAGAVLCHSKQVAQQICDQLQQLGMPAEFMEKRQIDLRKPVVKVLTIHSAKGLEFPFVAVMRLAQDHLPHNYDHLPAEERDAMIAQERRLFYVGCSRAMRALLVCADADQPSSFVLELPTTLWQREGEMNR